MHLPDMDDKNLSEQINNTVKSDSQLQHELAVLMYPLNFHEKMALGLNAYFAIDESHTQLCELKPKHGNYSPEVLRGIFLIQQLSLQGKAEFAADLLLGDWDLGSVEDAPSTVIEDRFDEDFYPGKTFSERCKDEGIDPCYDF